jgi:hypothetical protein
LSALPAPAERPAYRATSTVRVVFSGLPMFGATFRPMTERLAGLSWGGLLLVDVRSGACDRWFSQLHASATRLLYTPPGRKAECRAERGPIDLDEARFAVLPHKNDSSDAPAFATVQGWERDTLRFQQTIPLRCGEMTRERFGWRGIDRIVFDGGGRTLAIESLTLSGIGVRDSAVITEPAMLQ